VAVPGAPNGQYSYSHQSAQATPGSASVTDAATPVTATDPLAVMQQLGLVESDAPASAIAADAVTAAQPNLAEIRRLLKRKSELMATGAYTATDALILKIDKRVAELGGVVVG
jgi:hypothetical protein